MAQETSIEWLGHQIATMLMKDLSIEHTKRLSELLEIAGQKHEEEIEDAYGHGQNNGYMYAHKKAITITKENYYSQTYGNI